MTRVLPRRATTPPARRCRASHEVVAEWARLADRHGATVRLRHGHQQGVELVEERRIGRQACLEKRARVLVADAGGNEAMTNEHATGVGVGHEHWPTGGVEKNRVSRLGPQSRDGEQLTAQRAERSPAQPAKVATRARQEPAGEVGQPSGFEPPCAGRADQGAQRRDIGGRQADRLQQAGAAQPGDGPSGAGPRRVLHQDRPDGDLEGRARRPPTLRAMVGEQRAVQAQQACLDAIAGRAGDLAPRGEDGTA